MKNWKRLFDRRMLAIAFMGLSSGLPLALIGGTLQAWMTSESVSLSTIGLFALVGVPYTFKFLWSPFMDRYTIFPGLGRRRGWILITQILLALSIFMLSMSKPQENLWLVAFWCLALTFFAASQDIVVDAWRRETLADHEMGFGSSIHTTAYLFSMRMIGAALALILSDFLPWSQVYQLMILVVGLGIIGTLMSSEPNVGIAPPKSMREAVIEPFKDFFKKSGAILILIFILLYKVGDNMAAQMTVPFFMNVGFTKTEIGAISKVIGWVCIAGGGLLGGTLLLRYSLNRCLFWFGVLQAVTTLLFASLVYTGHSIVALGAVIGLENFAAGMGTAAFVAFMALLTNKKFTATQYALLTSLMGVPRQILTVPSGYLAENLGWTGFFIFCTVIALPGLALIENLSKSHSQEVARNASTVKT